MDYKKDFVQGVGREDVSLTRGQLQQDLFNQEKRDHIVAKYGVFIRGILTTLIRKKRVPASVDQDHFVSEFLTEKFPKVVNHYSKNKGAFRGYLRSSFIYYVIDEVFKKKEERLLSSYDLSEVKEEEQYIYENFDQECLKPYFQKLDQAFAEKKEIDLLFQYYAQKEQIKASLFSYEDFEDFSALILQLEQASDAVSQYIWEQFSYETQEMIDDFIETKKLTKMLQRTMVKEFNYLLRDEEFYEENRFSSYNISEELKSLALEKPEGKKLSALNRYLFEIVYPEKIAKISQKIPHDPDKFIKKYQRKKTEEFFKNKVTEVIRPLSFSFSEEEKLEFFEYFLKLYFREKFTFEE